jgi:hypothetical protein
MLAGCGILVGISYLMLSVLSSIIVVPQTPVQEMDSQGELLVPLDEGQGLVAMQLSADGRFLAYIENGNQGEPTRLTVKDLSGGGQPFGQAIQGQRLAWLGTYPNLVYEDQGDIFRLDLPQGTPTNLTTSPDNDGEPLPSPGGATILWKKWGSGANQATADFWIMDADGGNKRRLTSSADLPVWDPTQGEIMASAISHTAEGDNYFLETIAEGGPDWSLYSECDRKPLYLWWPERESFFYVAPYTLGGDAGSRGVWFRVDSPTTIKRVASTAGLSLDESHYQFFPSRRGQLLAYVGEKGMEYIDMQARILFRYGQLNAAPPLAWDERGGYLYYCDDGGIFRVAKGGD